MTYYPAALAKELLPTLLYLDAAEGNRSDARTAASSLTALLLADAFPTPDSDESYAACLRIAHNGLRSEIENDPYMDDADYVVADFLLDVMLDNRIRSVCVSAEEICASTGVLPEHVGLALGSLCGNGYFRAKRPSKCALELGHQAVEYAPQLDNSLLNTQLHDVSANGRSPDKLTLRGRMLVTYREDEEGNLQVQRP